MSARMKAKAVRWYGLDVQATPLVGAMMSTNGNSDPAEAYRRHFQSAERYRREVREAEQTAGRLRAEAERLAALADDLGEQARRSPGPGGAGWCGRGRICAGRGCRALESHQPSSSATTRAGLRPAPRRSGSCRSEWERDRCRRLTNHFAIMPAPRSSGRFIRSTPAAGAGVRTSDRGRPRAARRAGVHEHDRAAASAPAASHRQAGTVVPPGAEEAAMVPPVTLLLRLLRNLVVVRARRAVQHCGVIVQRLVEREAAASLAVEI